MPIRKLALTIAMTVLVIASENALALDEGETAQRLPFASGGVGSGERDALDQRRDEFSLWVIAAAKGSGAYLAGTSVKITDNNGNVVLATSLAGPWLLARLEPGEYTVEATHLGQPLQRRTVIGANGQRKIVFYFDVPADALPRAEGH